VAPQKTIETPSILLETYWLSRMYKHKKYRIKCFMLLKN